MQVFGSNLLEAQILAFDDKLAGFCVDSDFGFRVFEDSLIIFYVKPIPAHEGDNRKV
jgi:hypothetical protein